MLSGTISTGMCQSGSVLVTAHGDSAEGQEKPKVRTVGFLSLQDTQQPWPCCLLQLATVLKHSAP